MVGAAIAAVFLVVVMAVVGGFILVAALDVVGT